MRFLKIISFVVFLSIVLTSAAFAAEEIKPNVVIMYVNNAKTTYDKTLNKIILDNFNTTLGTKYTIVSGDRFIEKLKKVGIEDITTAERSDVVEAFKGESVDYIIYMELQPFVRKQTVTFFTTGMDMTAVVPFKIIDPKNNKYLYNGKFTEFARDSSVFGVPGNKGISIEALVKSIEKMDAVMAARLPAGADSWTFNKDNYPDEDE